MTKNITAALLISILMSSCSESKNASAINSIENNSGSQALYKNEWKLTEVQGQFVPAISKAMLAFTPGKINKVSGSTGCNRMTGTFELSGTNSIAFSPLALTRMACLDDNANKLQILFTEALTKTDNWDITNDQLILKNGDAVVAKLTTQMPVTTEQLKLNGEWELNYISGPKIAFEGLFPHKKPTLFFALPNKAASGNGSCNGYSVQVKVDGNKLQFGDPLSTMMACEGNGEPVYFKTLKTVTSYSVDENTLTLIMGDIAVMRFTKK